MSSFNALPREGHLAALYHTFADLAKADQHSIVFCLIWDVDTKGT